MKREPFYEFEARRGTPQEAQINAWATAVDTLDFFQQPQVPGREIPWAFEEKKVFDRIAVKDVWMSLMSAPDYCKRYPDCLPERKARLALDEMTMRWGLQGRMAWLPESVVSLIANNILSVSNSERIEYVRRLAESKKRVHYLARGMSTRKMHTLGDDVEIDIMNRPGSTGIFSCGSASNHRLHRREGDQHRPPDPDEHGSGYALGCFRRQPDGEA